MYVDLDWKVALTRFSPYAMGQETQDQVVRHVLGLPGLLALLVCWQYEEAPRHQEVMSQS